MTGGASGGGASSMTESGAAGGGRSVPTDARRLLEVQCYFSSDVFFWKRPDVRRKSARDR